MAAKYLLKDKVAIVTGAGAGIGQATALELAREGARVMVAELRADRGREVAAAIATETGADVRACCTDVRDEAQILACVAATVQAFGRIDVLINNASKIVMCPVLEMTTAMYEEIMRNNATSMVIFSREVARQMVKQGGGGAMVFLSSIHASLSEPNCSAYTAAKGAIEAYGRTLASELALHRIRVNMIQPGATYTELTTPMYTEAVKRALFERVTMKEIAQAAWIARGIVFLASDESRYMTGSTLVMDGGYRMDGSLPGAAYWKE